MSEIIIDQTDLNITVEPSTTQLNVYTGGYACAQGNTTEFQYNNGGVLSGANGLTYTSGSQTTTAANLTVTNNTNLGDIGNITITGGNAGEFLQTDGSGGLTFTEIANANFAAYAGNIIEPAQPNITSVGNLSNLTVTGNVTATYFLGNGSQLTGLAATDSISNGTSNVKVLSTNGNVAIGVNGNANILVATATGIVVPGANLGSVSNLIITGGNNGFYLQTDGTGNLSWVGGGGSGNGTVGGSNLQIQYNDGGVFGGTAGFTFNKASNLLSAPGGITAVGNVQGNYILGNGALLTGISGANANTILNGSSNIVIDANANIRMSLAGYSNIVEVGPANVLVTNSNIRISNGFFAGNAAGLTNIPAANISGIVPTANTATTAGTVTTAAQPNITSVGTLTNLSVSGTYTGNGFGLSYLQGSNIIGQVPYAAVANSVAGSNVVGAVSSATTATTAGTVTTAAQPNITSLGTLTGLGVNGTITAVNITANTGVFSGNGSGLTNVPAGNISGTVANATHACTANTVTNAAQSNITSLGSLTGLTLQSNADITLSGAGSNISGANLVSANFVTGTLTTAAQPNITSLGNLTTCNIVGNLRIGNGSGILMNANAYIQMSGSSSVITGVNYVVANLYAGKFDSNSNSQPNITSLGTLTNLDIAGNLTVNGNLIANVFPAITNGNSNVNIPVANGNINLSAAGNANILVITGTGANITGTFNTSGNANVGNLGTAGLITAIGNVSGGNLTTAGALSVTGNANVGNIGATAGVYTANISANNIITTNNITVGNLLTVSSGGANITGPVNLTGNFLPATTNTYNIGNSTNLWNDINLSNAINWTGNAYINTTGSFIVNAGGTTNALVVTAFTATINAGSLTLNGRYIKTQSNTIANLGSAIEGARAFATDANLVAAGNFGAIVSGGGANKTPVYGDGTNWRIG